MNRWTLGLCLTLIAGLTPLQAQPPCKAPASGIAAVAGGYTISLPAEIVGKVPTANPLRLALRDASGHVSAVSGPVRLLAPGKLMIATAEKFAASPQSCPLEAALQGVDLPLSRCFLPEHGPSCWLTWCAGQVFCVPGKCQCL